MKKTLLFISILAIGLYYINEKTHWITNYTTSKVKTIQKEIVTTNTVINGYPWLEGDWAGELFFHAEDKNISASLSYHNGVVNVSFPNHCEGEGFILDKINNSLSVSAQNKTFQLNPIKGDRIISKNFKSLTDIKVIYIQYYEDSKLAGWLEKTTITKEPVKTKKLMTTQMLDANNEKLQEELRVFYEKFFSDELHKALASSQNLHNPTFTPLIDAFPFAIRSTESYKKIEQKFKKNGYKIENKIEFEKFHTSSTKTNYGFHFSPLFFRPIPIERNNSNNEKVFFECREIIDVKLTPYFTKRKHFIKNNECMSKDDSLIINSKTKKSIELTGYGTAIKKFSLSDQEILQINSHMGTHTNGVSFFFIEKNGDLKLMKNGVMTSDVADPKVMLNNGIEVKTQYSKDEKLCRYLFEDTFTYDKKNKTFLKTKKRFQLLKRCADD